MDATRVSAGAASQREGNEHWEVATELCCSLDGFVSGSRDAGEVSPPNIDERK